MNMAGGEGIRLQEEVFTPNALISIENYDWDGGGSWDIEDGLLTYSLHQPLNWQDGLSKERFLIWIMMHLFLLFPQPVDKWAGQEKRLFWACLCGMSMGKRGTQSLGVSVTELRYGGWLPNHWRELMLENYSSHCPCGTAKISRDILPPHLQIVLCDSWGPKEPVPGTPTVTNSQPLVSAQSTCDPCKPVSSPYFTLHPGFFVTVFFTPLTPNRSVQCPFYSRKCPEIL